MTDSTSALRTAGAHAGQAIAKRHRDNIRFLRDATLRAPGTLLEPGGERRGRLFTGRLVADFAIQVRP